MVHCKSLHVNASGHIITLIFIHLFHNHYNRRALIQTLFMTDSLGSHWDDNLAKSAAVRTDYNNH